MPRLADLDDAVDHDLARVDGAPSTPWRCATSASDGEEIVVDPELFEDRCDLSDKVGAWSK
jgi:hypothetical protein